MTTPSQGADVLITDPGGGETHAVALRGATARCSPSPAPARRTIPPPQGMCVLITRPHTREATRDVTELHASALAARVRHTRPHSRAPLGTLVDALVDPLVDEAPGR